MHIDPPNLDYYTIVINFSTARPTPIPKTVQKRNNHPVFFAPIPIPPYPYPYPSPYKNLTFNNFDPILLFNYNRRSKSKPIFSSSVHTVKLR